MLSGNETPRHHLPRWISLLLVLLVAAALLAPGPWRQMERVGSTLMAPVQFGLAETGNEISEVLGTFQRVRELGVENERYREEIDRLHSAMVRMREIEVENRDLRNLLSLKERAGPGTLLPVSVIARDDTPYVDAITIDRGESGGVREGSVVVTHRGLVGRVVRANPTSAKVLLVTDLNSAVAVRLQTESRTTGVLRGQTQGKSLVIDYIPHVDVVRLDDVVITSGMGEVFPEGLVVGTVTRVQRKDAEPFQVAAVDPAVDMNKLERLYVIADRQVP